MGARASQSAPPPQELEQRAIRGDKFKDEGNILFKQEKYEEAVELYNKAVSVNGTQPVYMSNLAATYLKLEDFEMAEKAASMALLCNPRFTKARFRRGIARKEQKQFVGAMADFETILKEDPNCVDAQVELAAVMLLYDLCEGTFFSEHMDYGFPPPDAEPQSPYPMWEFQAPPDEDAEHVGNGIPCKHYNRKPDGCAKGEACAYSHASDARSVRDDCGRNVCLYFLLGACKFGDDRCLYSHSKEHVPRLWDDDFRIPGVKDIIYQNEQLIQEKRLFEKYMGKGPFASEPLLAMRRVIDESKAKKPFVLLLALATQEVFEGHVSAAIEAKLPVSQAFDDATALDFLSHPGLSGVFVTDARISEKKHAKVLSKLVEYARAGGAVVIGGMFSSFITPSKMAAFFRDAWGLPWKMGDYHRTVFSVNPTHELVKANPSLHASYSMKAVHLKDLEPGAAVYTPTEDSRLQSMVWAAEQITNLSEAPVCHVQIGAGYLGYIGDVNSEKSSTNAILAMLGLLDGPLPAPQTNTAPAPSKTDSPAATRFILHLALDDSVNVHDDAIAGLRDILEVSTVKFAKKAKTLLASAGLAGVFITDATIIHKTHANLLAKLAEYVRGGGTVVIGGSFSSFVNGMQAEAFFRKGWGLPWKLGSYHRTTFALNTNHPLVAANSESERASLPDAYSMKAVHLEGLQADAALYLPVGHSHLDSAVFHSKQIQNRTEAPVVFAPLGKGHLGFVGDVNSEKETTDVVIAMFGLTARIQ